VLFSQFHSYDQRRCDGCGQRTAIVETLRTQASQELEFCRNCFHELAVRLFHAAAQTAIQDRRLV
jgi:ribosomal protein S14